MPFAMKLGGFSPKGGYETGNPTVLMDFAASPFFEGVREPDRSGLAPNLGVRVKMAMDVVRVGERQTGTNQELRDILHRKHIL